ncbi:MAG TPA: hypothetical protein VGS21_06730 [Acidimicrobiales bacterium]|nr:hypothetical protein [Acidimicrobiales bacterium]
MASDPSNLGPQICASTNPLVLAQLGYEAGDSYLCLDSGKPTLWTSDVKPVLVFIDNQSGARVWVAGCIGTCMSTSQNFNFCLDHGYMWTFGQDLLQQELLHVDSITQGSTSPCAVGSRPGDFGYPNPYDYPYCGRNGEYSQGPHVATQFGSNSTLGTDAYSDWFCYDNLATPNYDPTYNVNRGNVSAVFVANASGHCMFVTLNDGTVYALKNNQVIYPVNSSIQNNLDQIVLTESDNAC